MTLMKEPYDPWYMPYTTLWFIISAFVFYPATAIACLLLHQPVHGVVHWTANILYASLLTLLIWKAISWTQSRKRRIK